MSDPIPATSAAPLSATPSRAADAPASAAPILSCSFCGKTQREVHKLVAGPKVYICDECVVLCNEIIFNEQPDAVKPAADAKCGLHADWPAIFTCRGCHAALCGVCARHRHGSPDIFCRACARPPEPEQRVRLSQMWLTLGVLGLLFIGWAAGIGYVR